MHAVAVHLYKLMLRRNLPFTSVPAEDKPKNSSHHVNKKSEEHKVIEFNTSSLLDLSVPVAFFHSFIYFTSGFDTRPVI